MVWTTKCCTHDSQFNVGFSLNNWAFCSWCYDRLLLAHGFYQLWEAGSISWPCSTLVRVICSCFIFSFKPWQWFMEFHWFPWSSFAVFVLLHTVPVIYDKYEDKIDPLAEKGLIEFKKQYAVFDEKVLSKIPKGPLKGKLA